MIKVGSNTVTFPYSKIYVGSTEVWASAAPASFPTYIEADGTQAINTGIPANATYKVEVDFELTQTSVDGVLFGETNTQGYTAYGKFSYRVGSRLRSANVNTPDLNRHQITINNGDNKYYLDNTEITTAGTQGYFHGANNIFVFNYFLNSASCMKAKLYSFKITDTSTNTVVCNMVPVVDTNGKAGLYDSVSGSIFYDYYGGTFAYA